MVDLIANCLSTGVLTRGVARKRREAQRIQIKSAHLGFHPPRQGDIPDESDDWVDPHKATHTAVAIDSNETMLDELRVRACSSQVKR